MYRYAIVSSQCFPKTRVNWNEMEHTFTDAVYINMVVFSFIQNSIKILKYRCCHANEIIIYHELFSQWINENASGKTSHID